MVWCGNRPHGHANDTTKGPLSSSGFFVATPTFRLKITARIRKRTEDAERETEITTGGHMHVGVHKHPQSPPLSQVSYHSTGFVCDARDVMSCLPMDRFPCLSGVRRAHLHTSPTNNERELEESGLGGIGYDGAVSSLVVYPPSSLAPRSSRQQQPYRAAALSSAVFFLFSPQASLVEGMAGRRRNAGAKIEPRHGFQRLDSHLPAPPPCSLPLCRRALLAPLNSSQGWQKGGLAAFGSLPLKR